MSDINLLDVVNQPKQKERAEKAKREIDSKRGNVLVRNSKWIMFAFANVVATLIDAMAVSTVWQLTNGNVLLAVLSVLPTAIPLYMWEIGWLYPLAEPAQKRKAIGGVALSVATALVIGGLAIVAALSTDLQIRSVVSIVLLGWCLIVLAIHAVLAALYFYTDPQTKKDHAIQVTVADHEHQKSLLDASGELLDAAERALGRQQALEAKYGKEETRAMLEILRGVDIDGDGTLGNVSRNGSGRQSSPQR
jgi:hypothetical protein